MSRFARLCAFAVLALARAVSGQIVLEPGDIIAGSTRPAVNGEGETYDAGKLIVFGRNGVLKGDFVELPTPPSEPLYWNGVIYVSTFDPRVIARVDSSGNLLSPFATNVSVAYLSPGPAQGLLGTNRSGELYQLDANGSVIRFRDSSTFP